MIFKREELEKMGISLVDEDGFDRDLVDIINEYEYKKIKDDECKFCTIIYDEETVEEITKDLPLESFWRTYGWADWMCLWSKIFQDFPETVSL